MVKTTVNLGRVPKCCGECTCPVSCPQTVTINVSGFGGTPFEFSGTIVLSVPGYTMYWTTSTGYPPYMYASVTCGNFGPNGEFGYLVEVMLCAGGTDPMTGVYTGFSDMYRAFVGANSSCCPLLGSLDFQCMNAEWDPDTQSWVPTACSTTIDGTIT